MKKENKKLIPQEIYDIFEEKMKNTKINFNFNSWSIEYNLLNRIFLCIFIFILIFVILQILSPELAVYWPYFSTTIFSLFVICPAINNYYESKKKMQKKQQVKL